MTSKKIVRGGKIANNTERDKWEQFISNCKTSHPAVKIILWDETTLQQQLTEPNAQGIYKYWFENTVIFDQLFELSYEKVVNGWAKLKYIPEIHTAGYIHEHMEKFLGSIELTKQRYEKICFFIGKLEALLYAYRDLLALKFPESENTLKCKLQKDLPIIQEWLKLLNDNKEAIKNGGRTDFIRTPLELNCSLNDIKESSLHFGKYFHFHEAEKLLENIKDEFWELSQILDDRNDNKIMFLGIQGTGKTAGIVAESSIFLSSKIHLPIIIHAKEFSEGDTWTSMIINSLGLADTWNEIELLGALQNAAFLRAYNANQEFHVEAKCVIIVDGIDESISWKFWKDKINETEAFQKNFPRIKFAFLSRPYVFPDHYKLPYSDSIYVLPNTGDGDLEEICGKYFSAYKIDIGDNLWIKQNLKSPVAVKLFCDIYRGQKIGTLPKNTVVLTELYKAKLASLEENYSISHRGMRESKPIHTALIELAELFAQNKSIQYQDIHDRMSLQLKDTLEEILIFLINEGFIYTFTKQEDDFSTPETFYSWGMQPAFDYLIAQKTYKSITTGERIEIKYVNGIYQMLSLIVIENGKLIIEYTNIKIEDRQAFELICYALANCSISTAEKYSEYLKKLMRYSVAEFREIFYNVVQSVIRTDNHPLGSVLLDEFLREFNNPAERDIWWSIPTYLTDSSDADWHAYTELDFDNIKLNSTDKYCAAPLTLAWSLSSVNNTVRQSSRYKLTSWGISQPLEYWKLFEKCISINDMQILEDLFAIAYGIALDQFVCDEYLTRASRWILDNLFNEIGLKRYENVALRYYGAGIVKIAITKGVLDSELIYAVIPPYNYTPEFLPIFKEALNSNRMGGYNAIDYDLARYVLCDHFSSFFRKDYNTKKFHVSVEAFLEKYKENFDIPELKVEGFIIAIAYQYLLNQGWNTEEFWNSYNKSKCGVDLAILKTYHSATHGEMSRIMTVAEKNVWLARHQIEAVIANEIPFCEDFSTFQYVKDYSQLENFINTYQDYANTTHRNSTHTWFNADLLAVTDFETMDKEKIENWMREETIPPFDKWLSPYNGNVLLSTVTEIQNNLCGVSETIWIATGAVKKSDFAKFLKAIEHYFDDRNEMLNVSEFYAVQECNCYCTPQEACLVHSEREINNSLLVPDSSSDIEVLKLTEECLSADELETEKSFTLPSKLARKLTGIVYGDGFSYSDNDGNIIASYSNDGNNWGTHQETLMIQNDALKNGLAKFRLKIFWLFYDYKEPSFKAREQHEKIMHSSDRTYLVWKEDNSFHYKILLPIEPSRTAENTEVYSDIEAILEKYGSKHETDS